jgi:pyruvate/2-oxoglutarate dehydrogenase complex dihydrolipoamide dehydrogenase (E3) component
MSKFDAIVIGSGQGGNPLAFWLADKGHTVALIEKAELGGTCINTGCTPTKTMVASAQVAHYVRNSAEWGLHSNGLTVDLAEVVARKNKVVSQWREGIASKIKARSRVHLYREHARFIGPHRVSAGAEELEADRIFINTGAREASPPIEGLDTVDYLTNVSIMQLTRMPEHLLVLGGSYIGLEFGQMFRRFGSRVTVIEHAANILPHEDTDVTDELRKALESEGIEFMLGASANRVEKRDGKIVITVAKDGQATSVTGSDLLVATGRRPNSDDLGLEAAGIETDHHGFIHVNNRLETNVAGVWALGDVKGGPAFTHISFNDYQIITANLEGKNLTTDNRPVPFALFTSPELGRVGMTEAQAREAGHRLKIGKIPMTSVARAVERSETAGLMKIVVDADNDRILGAAILSTDGGEIVQIIGAVMLSGAPYTVMKGAVYIHPTFAEGFWWLMEDVKPA